MHQSQRCQVYVEDSTEAMQAAEHSCVHVQVAILLPLFIFCWYMYNWETDENDQIPILPVEGEELPCNIKGPRLLREANFLQSLEKKLTGAGAIAA